MTPTQATATPDPCPFCNTELVLYKPRHGSDYYQHQRNECLLSVTGMGDPIIVFDDVAHIAAWNRRSSVPTPMSDSNDAIKADWDRVMSGLAPMSDSTVAAPVTLNCTRSPGEQCHEPNDCTRSDCARTVAAGGDERRRNALAHLESLHYFLKLAPVAFNQWAGHYDQVRASLSATGVPTAEPRTDHIRSVPGGAAFLRVAGMSATGMPTAKASDEVIREWAARHDLNLSATELRCIFEDAQSATGVPTQPSVPVVDLSPYNPHERRLIEAALDLCVAIGGAHAFKMRLPNTTPPLYLSLHEGEVQLTVRK